ncbi:MAG: hypothetical protein RBR15_15570 [Sphaerochaeta sp.]|nr:hypothetical protein [Sphaerochaeta sp.]
MNNYTELKKRCTLFSKGFEAVKQRAWEWGHSKKPIKNMMLNILASGPDQVAMDNEMQDANLYLIAEVFQDPKAMKQLRTRYEKEFIPAGVEALTLWEKHPAFWCFFSVKEHLSGDFYLIVDHLTGEEHILHSKGISTFQKLDDADALRFLCVMQPNGQCLQTVGTIKYYRILVSDFLYYCTLFKPEEGLQAIIHKHFIRFFKLDDIANIPVLKQDSHDMLFIWQPFTLPDFDSKKLGGEWFSTTQGTIHKFTYKVIDTSMQDLPNFKEFQRFPSAMDGLILRDDATDEMGIYTNTEISYAFLSALLNRSYPMLNIPTKPSYLVSGSLQHALTGLNIPEPWNKFEPIIEYREPKDTKEKDYKEELEKLREEYTRAVEKRGSDDQELALYGVYLDAMINGKPIDIDAVCKITGMEREDVENIRRRVDDLSEEEVLEEFNEVFDDDFDEDYEYVMFQVPEKEKVYELQDLPMPPDYEIDEVLYNSLSDSEIFVISLADSEEAQRHFIQLVSEDIAAEFARYGMLKNIERLFAITFDQELVFPLMNAFIWILLHKGREWVPVRSYAIELLKWIPAEIKPFYAEPEEFIEALSKFVKKLLCTRGICSLTKRPNAEETKTGKYTIKGTEALLLLLQVRDVGE